MERTITMPTGDGPMNAFIAEPAGSGRGPALLVCQEAFGVNSHIKNVCRRLADAGYVALAPELFHRSGAGIELGYTDFAKVMPYFQTLTNQTLLTDVRAGLKALRGEPRVDPNRVAVIGFCVGGFATFLAAEHTDAAAFVAFYGGGIVHTRPGINLTPLLDDADKIRKPILLLFGGQDQSIPEADVKAIEARLQALGTTHEIVTLPQGGHGFACDERASYDKDSADQAWRIAFDWLKRTLANA